MMVVSGSTVVTCDLFLLLSWHGGVFHTLLALLTSHYGLLTLIVDYTVYTTCKCRCCRLVGHAVDLDC
jgi:hypothetical protein